jgi:hypothetical protein
MGKSDPLEGGGQNSAKLRRGKNLLAFDGDFREIQNRDVADFRFSPASPVVKAPLSLQRGFFIFKLLSGESSYSCASPRR